MTDQRPVAPSSERSEGVGRSPGRTVVYLHGFLSSGVSTKAQFFRERFGTRADAAFHALDFNPTPRDFETMTVTGQINRVRQYLLDHDLAGPGAGEAGKELTGLIGSSFGGWVGLHYAHRFGGIGRLLLLAPALVGLTGIVSEEEAKQWQDLGTAPVYHPAFERELPVSYDLHADSLRYLEPVEPAAPTLIIHGRDDEHVPIDHSRAYAEAFPNDVQLVEVDAGHDLNEHLDLIWTYVVSFLLGGEEPS
jgi:hypothetical protein